MHTNRNLTPQTSSVFESEVPQLLTSDTQTLAAPAGIVFTNLHVTDSIVAVHSKWEHYLQDVIYKVRKATVSMWSSIYQHNILQDDGAPIITGAKNFQGEVKTDFLHLFGPLNNVDVSHYVTLDTSQTIPGKYITKLLFIAQLTFLFSIIEELTKWHYVVSKYWGF